jgi:hypothetical protein
MWPPQLALGAHTWHVDAVDAAGNATSSATRTVVVVASLPAAAGPPAPAPAPAPAPVVDTTAPLGTLKLTSAQGLRTILAKGLAGSTTSNEAGPRTVEIVLDAKTAKKLHLGAKALVVGRATVASAPPGVRAFTVKLTARAKAKLRTLRSVNVTIRATLKDVTGNALVVVRAATIRR